MNEVSFHEDFMKLHWTLMIFVSQNADPGSGERAEPTLRRPCVHSSNINTIDGRRREKTENRWIWRIMSAMQSHSIRRDIQNIAKLQVYGIFSLQRRNHFNNVTLYSRITRKLYYATVTFLFVWARRFTAWSDDSHLWITRYATVCVIELRSWLNTLLHNFPY